MATEFDNRLRLPPSKIDFNDDVGITGQDHDDYPSPSQARYDWMRMYLIGLLANQSSHDRPSQFRTGTLWYDRNINAFRYYEDAGLGATPSLLSKAIPLTDGADSDTVLTLDEWYAIVQSKITNIYPKATWSGSAAAATTSLTVPDSIFTEIQNYINYIRPVVYINGIMVDPRNSRWSSGLPVVVELIDGASISKHDRYTVITERFDKFLNDEIVVG